MRYFAFTKETDGGPLNLAVSKQINSKQYGLTSLVNYKPFSKSRDSTQGNHWPHLHGVWMKMNVVGFERNPVIETMSTNNAFYRGDFSNKELLCQTIWQTWIMKDSQPLEPCSAQFVKALEGEKSRNADAMQIMLKLKQKINFNHPYFKRTRSLVWSPENNDRLLTRYRQFVGHTVWFKITNTKFPPLYGSQKLLLINEVLRNLVFVSDQTCPLNTLTWNFFPAFWIVNLFFHTASLELSVNWK